MEMEPTATTRLKLRAMIMVRNMTVYRSFINMLWYTDAPINEAGDLNFKFYLFKEIFTQINTDPLVSTKHKFLKHNL